MNPGFSFTSLKSVQSELTPVIQGLIPENCTNLPVPYLTDGDELGERLLIYQTKDLLIEEVRNDEETVYRRLIFSKNLSQIQSQFRVIYKENSEKTNKNKQFPSLLIEKPGFFAGIDHSFLDFECHKLIVVGLALMSCEFFEQKIKKVAVLGGGLCALSGFLYEHFAGFHVETVEIDENIIKLAKELFELREDCDDFRVICEDAWGFIEKKSKELEGKLLKNNENEEKYIENEDKCAELYDLLIIDINSEDCEKCSPPAKFLSAEFLLKMQSCLRSSGMVFINFISKDEKILQTFLQELSQIFHLIYSAKAEDEYNTVIYAKNIRFLQENKKNCNEEEEKIIVVEQESVLSKKTIEQNFKLLAKNLKKQWDLTLNLEHLLGNLVLQHPNLNKNPFEKKNAHFVDFNENFTNNTKEMYIKDLEKVNKKKKKKKNKKK